MCETTIKRWLLEAANSPCWCDVTIYAAGRKYRAHRIVLSSASPFIRRLLLSRPSEDVPMTIVLADVSADTVEALLQYIYNGEVYLLPDQLNEFLNLSKQLLIFIDENDIQRMRAMTFNIESETENKKTAKLMTDKSKKYYQANGNSFVTKNDTDTFKSGHNKLDVKRLDYFSNYLKQKTYRFKDDCEEKNLDLEIFIKSDKISKNTLIDLPEIPHNDVNNLNTNIIDYENYRSNILKNALGHKAKNEKSLCDLSQCNISDKTISYADSLQHIVLNTNHQMQFPSICSKGDIPYLSPKITESLKTLSVKSEYDDIFSDSSCEILEENNDNNKNNITEKNTTLFRNESKAHVDVMNLQDSCQLVTEKKFITQESGILNLVYDPKSTIQSFPLENNRASYNNGHSNFDSQMSKIQNIKIQTCRNEKLVRPIPSLMPIEIFSSILDLTSNRREISKVLHTTVDSFNRNNIFKQTSNSAFDQVSNNISNEYFCRSTAAVSDSLVNQTNERRSNDISFNGKESLRFGFSQKINEQLGHDCCSIIKHPVQKQMSYNDCGNLSMKDIPISEDILRVKKKMLYNKVLACPWSIRGPVLYCQGNSNLKNTNRPEEIQRKGISIPGNSLKSELATDTFNRNNHVTDVCNDNNNNLSETEDMLNKKERFTSETYKTINKSSPEKIKEVELLDVKLPNENKDVKILPRENIPHYAKTDEAVQNNLNNYGLKKIDRLASDVISCEGLPQLSVMGGCASKSSLACEVCAKVFTSASTLELHQSSHSSRARYRCDQCDKCFSQLRNYKYHVSVHKGTKEFAATCNVCGKYFNDRGYLSSHMKIHRNRKEYQCPHCPKSFNQRVAYNMHVRIHTGVKPHQCEACGKAFSRKMLLKQHARTHSGEKPYACAACGKRFADRSNMTLHMRLHSGVKPFSCTLCPKSFTKKHHLKTHLNYHTGNKPYACEKCSLTFSQSSNMRTHMKKCSSTSPPS